MHNRVAEPNLTHACVNAWPPGNPARYPAGHAGALKQYTNRSTLQLQNITMAGLITERPAQGSRALLVPKGPAAGHAAAPLALALAFCPAIFAATQIDDHNCDIICSRPENM